MILSFVAGVIGGIALTGFSTLDMGGTKNSLSEFLKVFKRRSKAEKELVEAKLKRDQRCMELQMKYLAMGFTPENSLRKAESELLEEANRTEQEEKEAMKNV